VSEPVPDPPIPVYEDQFQFISRDDRLDGDRPGRRIEPPLAGHFGAVKFQLSTVTWVFTQFGGALGFANENFALCE